MAVKIRLARRGRKKLAMYDIVVADARAPRDGRFIEKLGTYNPNTNPASISLKVDQAVNWVLNGAQPTDTARAILSYKGVMYKKHLQVGVLKGAITQEQADAKFAAWVQEKDQKISNKSTALEQSKAKNKAARLEAEAKVSANRADAIAAKNKAEDEAVVASVVEAIQTADEEAAGFDAEAVAEASASSASADEVSDAPVAEESASSASADEVSDAPVAEVSASSASADEVVAEVVAEAPVAEALEATAADEVSADEEVAE